MGFVDSRDVKEKIRVEYESTRTSFHTLLDSLSEADLRKQSLNPGWTNGEILFHMTFAFMILSALIPLVRVGGHLPRRLMKLFAWFLNSTTGPFNWINGLGARVGGRLYRGKNIGVKFNKVYGSLLRKLDATRDSEWTLGMYYPTKWEGLFKEYMTLEDVFRYPIRHFEFHLAQISR